jgi:hypothetical protein
MEKKEGQMLIGSAPAWSRGAPRINREGERVNAVAVTRAGAPVSFFYTEGVATQIWERERERDTDALVHFCFNPVPGSSHL